MFDNNCYIRYIALGLFVWMSSTLALHAQDKGVFSGGVEMNINYFQRDSLIGAVGTPQYDSTDVIDHYGGELWVTLNYRIKGWEIGVRGDLFQNSNLRDPNGSYSGIGLGRLSVSKRWDKLELSLGHIYDQIGSGLIYRAWESRPLFIDNALVGGAIKYDLTDYLTVRAFAGKQKWIFGVNPGEISGVALDGFFSFGTESPLTISPGIGFVNRRKDQITVDELVDVVRNYIGDERIELGYNNQAYSLYNTLTYKNITWYSELALKGIETFRDPNELKTEVTGVRTFGKYVRERGSVIYNSISYARKGLGITVEAKRTENFNFRSDPTLGLNLGLINFMPPMNRQNTYRLTARYSPATQDLSEIAYQFDLSYKFNRKLSANVNYSNIKTLDGTTLYREYFTEWVYKQKRKWQLSGGLQIQNYNQEVYEVKPEVPLVKTITPFAEFLYRFTRKKSLRIETQYMNTDQDFGSWFFAQLELGLAPHWIIELSGMYNSDPNENSSSVPRDPETKEVLNILYPTVGVTYIHHSNRLSLRYVKQVEGIVCSGGICRLEPAFSGVRMSFSSTF